MNNNKKRRQPKTIWDFLRECPLVSLILLSVIGYTLYALVGAMGGEYKLRISKDHTLFMSAMIKEDPFVKKDDTKKPSDDTTATGTDSYPPIRKAGCGSTPHCCIQKPCRRLSAATATDWR